MLNKSLILFIKFLLILGFFLYVRLSAYAESANPAISRGNDNLEKIYLLHIVNQLDAIQPLLFAAKRNELPHLRIQFHYTRYQDNRGTWHQGLLEDVQSMKAGILEYVNEETIEPRVIQPLKNDYLMTQSIPMANFEASKIALKRNN